MGKSPKFQIIFIAPKLAILYPEMQVIDSCILQSSVPGSNLDLELLQYLPPHDTFPSPSSLPA
jgi:hypothetical protein